MPNMEESSAENERVVDVFEGDVERKGGEPEGAEGDLDCVSSGNGTISDCEVGTGTGDGTEEVVEIRGKFDFQFMSRKVLRVVSDSEGVVTTHSLCRGSGGQSR